MKTIKIAALVLLLTMLASCASSQAPSTPPTTIESEKPVVTPTQSPVISLEPSSEPINPEPTFDQDGYIESLIDAMTTEERAAQLFMVKLGNNGWITKPSELSDLGAPYPGGYVLFAGNITGSVQELLASVSGLGSIPPLIGIDEEGGTVSRLDALPGYEKTDSAKNLGKAGTASSLEAGRQIGAVLSALGVHIDFAPVCDILTNPNNKVIGSRSFGGDPRIVSDMALAFAGGLRSEGILCAAKHFPGHGDTSGDSHSGAVSVVKSLSELYETELIPFAEMIDYGAEFILVGHISLPRITDNNVPATLSRRITTGILRDEMGYDGIIITDAMDMGAITDTYSPGEAAVKAILAGIDIVLMPEDYEKALEGVLEAMESGTLSEERIRQSLRRIFMVKMKLGLI